MNPRVISVEPKDNFHLLLTFENEEKKIFDVNPYLDKGIFKELKTEAMFCSVRVDNGTVTWSNEADFCPDTLYIDSEPIIKS